MLKLRLAQNVENRGFEKVGYFYNDVSVLTALGFAMKGGTQKVQSATFEIYMIERNYNLHN